MYWVGIISENQEIIEFLEKEFDKNKVSFINLGLKTIENFKNIKFHVILISNLENYNKNSNFRRILSNSDITVINTDIKDNLKVLENLKGRVITYGFNQKATVTVSSVNDTNISIYIQRKIENVAGKKINPIEYVGSIEKMEKIELSDIIGVKTIENLLT